MMHQANTLAPQGGSDEMSLNQVGHQILLDRLQKALDMDGGTHTISDVFDEIEEGNAQLWRSEKALVVTEIKQAPQQRILHFWLAAGELDDVLEIHRQVIEWGKTQGCTRATLAGRKGWERVLASEGWAPELTVMGREI